MVWIDSLAAQTVLLQRAHGVIRAYYVGAKQAASCPADEVHP